MIRGREDISFSTKRLVIKIGTSVLSPVNSYFNLTNMANIVEQAAQLHHEGRDVIIVSSGAAGVGRQLLSKQAILRQSMAELLSPQVATGGTTNLVDQNLPGVSKDIGKAAYNGACAATGQLGLMSLYETMFAQYDITIAQILVTSFDFTSPERRRNVQYVLAQLLSKGVVPLLNENDPVSLSQSNMKTFSDNDALASLVSIEMSAQLCILLTDVQGVYDSPPSLETAKVIDTFYEDTEFIVGEKSQQGRGGMRAKVDAAKKAIKGGVQGVIIANGFEHNVIQKIFDRNPIGTLFLKSPEQSLNTPYQSTNYLNCLDQQDSGSSGGNSMSAKYTPPPVIPETQDVKIELVASKAKQGSRELQLLTSSQRSELLMTIASSLQQKTEEILKINAIDVSAAQELQLAPAVIQRLKLTPEKIVTLVKGIKAIAEAPEPLGATLSKMEMADGLVLEKVKCPIGVLLIIFESRPDCLPQIAALALKSGNALILKGGKEAESSNAFLHSIITDCIANFDYGSVKKDVIGLVQSRYDIAALLKYDAFIDLVIPRGSNSLVQYIKANTNIPVLGHADGVCHVFVDENADKIKASRIIVDSKTDYPSACNAAETLLLHYQTVESGVADHLLRNLRAAGVQLFGGPLARKIGLLDMPSSDMHTEFGDLRINVEIVYTIEEAIAHINTHSSGHTECIVTEKKNSADLFIKSVDSACVFVNASTRFSDGYRFGLGAEVGISTGKIHARGPVGIEGLMSTKWILRSTSLTGSTAASFGNDGTVYQDGIHEACTYTHKSLL